MKWRFLVIVGLMISWSGCTHDKVVPIEESPHEITLKWNPAYPTETMTDVVLGLNWAFANLGATHTNDATNGFEINSQKIIVNTELLGFSAISKLELEKLHRSIKASEEYLNNGAVDVGRYVTLLLGASAHYYRITGVPEHLSGILNSYTLQLDNGYLDKSGVALSHRIISYSAQNGLNQLFISAEIDSISKSVLEFETMELLTNGHIRFGIFDADSNRINAADPQHSNAGKPAKCMWCHESKILPLFVTQRDEPGYLPFANFRDTLDLYANELTQMQQLLPNGIDFTERQNHYKMELLYLSFMFPTPKRLSSEWNMTEDEVKKKLAAYMLFLNPEFPYLGSGYLREDVAPYAPYKSLKVSTSVREESILEVNYID